MKELIIDTDIGIDCDDAVALGLTAGYVQSDKCTLKAVTCATTREYAPHAAGIILNYYGITCPIGKMTLPPLGCDATDTYGRALYDRYGGVDAQTGAVELLRKTLSASERKLTLVTIGPLSNIAALLCSGRDEYSPLDGEELVRRKVDAVFLMAGRFDGNKANKCEFNIEQDIKAAQIVADRCPAPMVYCPFEVGARVFSYPHAGDNPVFYAMYAFARACRRPEKDFRRECWDPITCMLAIEGNCAGLSYSPRGRVAVQDDGKTVFTPDPNGLHRYVILDGDPRLVETAIEAGLS